LNTDYKSKCGTGLLCQQSLL